MCGKHEFRPMDPCHCGRGAGQQTDHVPLVCVAPHIPLSQRAITAGNSYGNELHGASTGPWTMWAQEVLTRGHVGDYTDPNSAYGTIRPDWARYTAARAGWSRAQHVANFGRVVQTFRQAVARIVRRAKWRRIIRALRLRARIGEIPAFGGDPGGPLGTHRWERARMRPIRAPAR